MEIKIIDKELKNTINVEFNYKVKSGEIDFKNEKVIFGVGEKNKITNKSIKKILPVLLNFVKNLKKDITFDLRDFDESLSSYIFYYLIFSEVKIKDLKSDKEEKEEKDIYLLVKNKQLPALVKTSFVGDSINYVRELSLLPGNIATPLYISEEAKKLSKKFDLKYEELNFNEMEELGLNALLSVARGSYNEPVMPILKYSVKNAKKTILVVGKGITFDTGGISLKPSKGMEEMKYDKCGAITVLGIMKTIAEMEPKINVIGVMPLCENMPSGNASRPGDVVTAYNGKSIEILNTDAEGRMILADALAYGIEKYKPDYVFDLATLTGACSVALGSTYIALLGNNQEFIDLVNNNSKNSFDQVWQLPLTEEFNDMMKSKFADIKNISDTGDAGTITGAAFLSFFVGETKWIHLDIASTAYVKGNGPTGAGLSVVVESILNLEKKK